MTYTYCERLMWLSLLLPHFGIWQSRSWDGIFLR